ncbi:stearoyl-CoA desaturase (delta-9 desaturase) [Fonticula alba]|uniref:Stearoyl-CoA desaturase (Delta-9 desaturase) n=1 Tax=Fonticula alba TaxID=691883 RepID=A0A058Z2U9_FONAL|nr:stearoyl-CoA desaturase (delta-9 desaturase) [Fonticula alba]KCV67847.1 stearoyl-CoA desaturase (delta-9 desaturase) [Fonticula alba]|eukprot:XP_009497667.1 stearoyl-CoA desaturase (delta-9 desaturase) [Fonticula alba]
MSPRAPVSAKAAGFNSAPADAKAAMQSDAAGKNASQTGEISADFHAINVDTKYFPGLGFRKVASDPRDAGPGPNWLHIGILFAIPVIALYGVLTTTLQWRTLVLAVVCYGLAGFGITGGYHRMYSHRSWYAPGPVRFVILMLGAAAVQGSCKWWSRNHRAHHKFTDTSRDPYNVRKGFLYAHIGWMLQKQDPKEVGRADISDLNADWMVQFQHRHYLALSLLLSIVVPTMIAGLGWGDYRGGYFYACLCRILFVHHATFFVNSLAHYLGEQAYSDLHTAFDSSITALLTLGEGYHNYHHEFPQDYRNGIRWYHFDPTKWGIQLLHKLGLAYDLRFISENEIRKARLQVQQGRLDEQRNTALHGRELDRNLTAFSGAELRDMVRARPGRLLIVLDGRVFDVTEFADIHPGGWDTIRRHTISPDAKEDIVDFGHVFRGADNTQHVHSVHAVSLLARFIVGAYVKDGAAGPDLA